MEALYPPLRAFLAQPNRDISTPFLFESGFQGWYNLEGQLHREDGPAIIYEEGPQEWYYQGKVHRVDGPAITHPDGSKEYFLEDKSYLYEEWLEKRPTPPSRYERQPLL